MPSLTRTQAHAIIEAGVLAPSADNHHRVRFSIGADEIHVLGDARFADAPFHRRVLALIALGAVVENMTLRAAALGLNAAVTWDPAAVGSSALAVLRLTPSAPVGSDLEAAIPRRHTNRRVLFKGPELPAQQRTEWTREVESVGGVRLIWLDARDLRRRALRLVRLAETERFRSQSLHADLFEGIRFDVDWSATVPEGLPPGALEIEPPMRPLFKALRHWPLMRGLAAVGVARLIGMRAAYVPCRAAPHLCALATTADLDHGAIDAGRALERIWLRATCQGLAFQPLAASTLLALEGYREVDGSLRRRLSEGWRAIAGDAVPLMVFRVGHAAPPAVRAGRPPVSAFLAEPTAASGTDRSPGPPA